MTAASRYWDSPTAGMPADLAAIARKNLAATDRSINGFNDRAKYFATPIAPPSPLTSAPAQSPPAPTFQFNLNGYGDASQLALPSIPTTNAVNRITPSTPVAPSLQTVQPQFGQTSLDKAYSTSPDAYNQISSAPPEHRQQYGWGQ